MDELYGIDWSGPCGVDAVEVTVPEIQLPRQLTEMELDLLPHPDGTEQGYGVHSYVRAVEMINSLHLNT